MADHTYSPYSVYSFPQKLTSNFQNINYTSATMRDEGIRRRKARHKKKLQRGHFVEYFNIVFVSIGKEYTYRSIVKHTTNR